MCRGLRENARRTEGFARKFRGWMILAYLALSDLLERRDKPAGCIE
ncbi:MAG: hypothetical protein V7638_4958 [Acidobacteriota bacterium]